MIVPVAPIAPNGIAKFRAVNGVDQARYWEEIVMSA